ncbi:MAG: hypothetical protein ACFB8W_04070 [Elainellaceae cyanobacterium]
MKKINSGISVCRYCQHYLLEGRRGGQCQQLGIHVQGCWKACSLAIPPFAPSWETCGGIKRSLGTLWQHQAHSAIEGISADQAIEALEACMQAESVEPQPKAIAEEVFSSGR